MTRAKGRVSVVMAVHNGLPYLEEAVSSVLSQTLEDFVMIVVDDGSTDGSLEYLRTLTDSRLRIRVQETRSGAGPARNVGIEAADSEYVAFMDADDISLPGRLRGQAGYLDCHPGIGAVGTLVSYCTDSGRAGFGPPIALDHDGIRADLLAGRHAIVNATLMIRAELLKRLGGFKVAGYGEDWDLLLRLTEAGSVANLDEVFYLYRLNPRSSSLVHSRVCQLRIAHACECARRRASGQEETSFEDFSAQQRRRPLWNRWGDLLDQIAVTQYHRAMTEVLDGNAIGGCAWFLLASAIAPQRVLQRVQRTVRHWRVQH